MGWGWGWRRRLDAAPLLLLLLLLLLRLLLRPDGTGGGGGLILPREARRSTHLVERARRMDTDPNIYVSDAVKKTSPSSSSSSSEAGSDPIVGSRATWDLRLVPAGLRTGPFPCESGNSDEPCRREYVPGGIKRIPSDTFFSPPASLTDARFLGPSLIAC